MLHTKVFISKRSAVATEHPLASLAGLEALMLKGGNAFDAATAISFALSVVQPQLSGMGGDFFALFYSTREKKVFCLNSSGWAPSAYTVEAMRKTGKTRMDFVGPLTFVVPGMVKGVYELHKRFGSLEFPSLMRRAVVLAEEGFPASIGLVESLRKNAAELPPEARSVLMPSGVAPLVGDLIRQPSMARTLREVAEGGPDSFYGGRAGEIMRRVISEKGGLGVDEDDLTSFAPEWCDPLEIDHGGARVYEAPPNSMGATTLLILKLLRESRRRGGDGDREKPDSPERIISTVDAAKRAYRRKDEVLGDPRFVGFDFTKFLEGGDGRGPPPGQTRLHEVRRADTTYFSVSDSEGNCLSCVQSLFEHFGSRVYLGEAGFFLSNRGSSFRFEGPNVLEPRKRPLHTLSALIIEWPEGKRRVAIGASGGEYRPQQHALFVTNLVDYAMPLERAIDYPRFLWDGRSSVLVEDGLRVPASLPESVERVDYPGYTGVAQGTEVTEATRKGVCDIRGDGIPLGE